MAASALQAPLQTKHSGGLADLLVRIMAPSDDPEEKSLEELAQMSGTERAGYPIARTNQETDDVAETMLKGLGEEQARVVLAQIAEAEAAGGAPADEDEDDDETLLESVRNWMAAQAQPPESQESLRDFNLKVRFQGHVETTPPDHLSAILRVLSSQVCVGIDSSSPPKQPTEVSAQVAPMMARWAFLIEQLYRRCGILEVTDLLVTSVSDGVASARVDLPEAARNVAVVGFLMAVRDELECVTDEDILAGCHMLESESKVMQKFIEFLQEAVESSDGSEGIPEPDDSWERPTRITFDST